MAHDRLPDRGHRWVFAKRGQPPLRLVERRSRMAWDEGLGLIGDLRKTIAQHRLRRLRMTAVDL